MIKGNIHLLKILSEGTDAVAKYISEFLKTHENSEISDFVDNWFSSQASAYLNNPHLTSNVSVDLENIKFPTKDIESKSVRFLSIQPNYFRGFRKVENPIILQGDLVVLDGRNSSGKTSFTEALEWVLTGHIIRRELGDPKELAECITNRFKPENEDVWVELILDSNGTQHIIKRLLISDYSSKKNSYCETQVFLDGEELEAENTSQVLETLFSGVLPLLMQHTLRQFVLDTPQKRRDYFEQLLNLDVITTLIEKSVVSDSRLDDFPSETGSIMLAEWMGLKSAVSDKQQALLRRVENLGVDQIKQSLNDALRSVAINDYQIDDTLNSIDDIIAAIQRLQRLVRQSNFPLLEALRPKRTLDEALINQLSPDTHSEMLQELLDAQSQYQLALKSAETITESQIAISRSLQSLRDAGLIIDNQDQVCPLCDFQDIPTLSIDRITEISEWDPVSKAVSIAQQKYQHHADDMLRLVDTLLSLSRDLIPQGIPDEDWLKIAAFQDTSTIEALRSELEEANTQIKEFHEAGSTILTHLNEVEPNIDLEEKLQAYLPHLTKVVHYAQSYATKFRDFENYVSVISSKDQLYNTRELWLSIADKSEVLLLDLRWENAKRKSQQELSKVREVLIAARQKYLDSRRIDFSEGISEIWNELRSDRYSSFSELFIPEPKGRGFPVKIEVKALLDNNSDKYEVDALGVFSKSQINAIGIAAFITRSKLMGHTCLVFDDPVQSMDEEHYKTFASNVLSHLCDEGFQVIVLTHSDLFAREVSYAHMDRSSYVTVSISHSRRKGCYIEEGNRRVTERLDRAVKYAEDGNLQQAWYYVRVAIERLYTVVQVKHGPSNFKPASWANHSAEAMWNEGLEPIFEKFAPNSSQRLNEILTMTAGGAHDKSPDGITNLMNAVNDIRPLPNKLRVGG